MKYRARDKLILHTVQVRLRQIFRPSHRPRRRHIPKMLQYRIQPISGE